MALQWQWSWASKPLGQPWQSLGLELVGVLFLMASVYDIGRTYRFLSSAEVASGHVIRLAPDERGGLAPVFQWVDQAGQYHEKVSRTSSSPPQFQKGQPVRVYYIGRDAENARIDDFMQLWLFALVTGVLGIAFVTTGVLVWVYREWFYTKAGYPELSGVRKRQ